MQVYRASWVLPVSAPPIRNGWVALDGGLVAGVGGAMDSPQTVGCGAAERIDLGEAVIMPALVNAHTHLELSWLRGRTRPASSFLGWVSGMMRERLQSADGRDDAYVRAAMALALDEMKASGTGLVGDISNSLAHLDVLQASGLEGIVFHEVIKFRATDPEEFVDESCRRIEATAIEAGWRLALAPHAPYSVAPSVYRALAGARPRLREARMSVHVAESAEEVEFIGRGSGGWPDLLKRLGAWDPDWRAPQCSPIEYLERLGFWDERTLAVHAVQASPDDLAVLATRGVTLVTCPRSNAWVGAGVPPVEDFYRSGARVAIGTDSLTSVADLNLFSELAALRRLAPGVRPGTLLRSATMSGAEALGFGGSHGTIALGRRAALIAVEVPPGTADVEEYLVSGIEPGKVRWIDQIRAC
ncbi:MAG: amidohydrolase family protein [Vicinamibacterales bacterium]|jgi:cytosine/adenosine deaminase-related metal-dependent hydrolase|nr:amidohydrolase family protein [Vicinamibacterales bacterium]